MRLHTLIPILLSITLLIFVFGCGDDDPVSSNDNTDDPVGTVIDSMGGTFSFASGNVVLTVPEGALNNSFTFNVRPESGYPSDGGYVDGTCYDFTPEGVPFDLPVVITIKYSKAGLPEGVEESSLKLCKVVGDAWETVSGYTLNADSSKVNAPVSSFSSYGIVGVVSDVGNVYEGDYYIYDSTTLADFQDYTSITGTLEIRSDAPDSVVLPNLLTVGENLELYGPPAITHNLVKVSIPGLTSIASRLLINNCDLLKEVNLPNCASVGTISVTYNMSLENLDGVSGIVSLDPTSSPSLGSIVFRDNDSLLNFDALSSISGTAMGIVIYDNPLLESLAGLGGISYTDNELEIRYCHALTDLNGVNLVTCGGNLIIDECINIQDFTGLDQVSTVGGQFQAINLPAVTDMSGLGQLVSANGFYLVDMSGLEDLNGLNLLTTINQSLQIENCVNLTDISDLSSVTTISAYVRLWYLDSLTSLTGLDNITHIGGGLDLRHLIHITNVDPLSDLDYIDNNLLIDNCWRLTSLNGLYGLKTHDATGYVLNWLTITENSMAGDGGSSLGNQTAWDFVEAIGGESKVQNPITIDGN